MKGKTMKKIVAICMLTVIVLISGCSFIAPSVSKALTEKEQSEMLKQEVALLKEQNAKLERIAIALEILAKK